MNRIRDALRFAGFLAQEGASTLRDTWGIALLAVVLAISLWVFVTDQDNPQVTGRVPGSIPVEVVNVPGDQAVTELSQETVSVRVRAAENVFDDLAPDDFRATLVLTDINGPTASVAVTVVPNEPRVEVVEVTPARIDVTLEPVTSVAVPVEVAIVGTPPRGFELDTVVVEPEEAVVTGPESLVQLVQVVEVDLSLTGLPASFEETLLLQPRDGRGGTIEGVTVSPESAVVRVDLTQLEFSSVFVIVPEVSGTPASGFQVTGISVEPQFVTVTGTADVFRDLDPVAGIATEPVVVDGASADVVRPVALRLPENAGVTQPTVTVRIAIAPIGGQP